MDPNNKTITKEKMKEMIVNAPKGITGQQLIERALKNGYTIEGLDVKPTDVRPAVDTTNIEGETGLGGLATGVVKGALSTIKGLGNLGAKMANAILPKKAEGPNVYSEESLKKNKDEGGTFGKILSEENLKAKTTSESIGKGAEQIAEFFIPAGKITQLEKLLAGGAKLMTAEKLIPLIGEKAANIVSKAASLGTKMAIRSGEAGGVIAVQSGGDKEQVETAAKVGGAIPAVAGPISKIASKATEFLGGVGKRLAGALSGRGTGVIDEIIADPKSALEGMTKVPFDTLQKDSKMLKEAAVNMKIEAGKEYHRVVNNLQEIYENEMKPKGFVFDKGTEINKAVDILEEKFGITTAGKIAQQTGEEVADKGKLDFESSRFLPKEAQIIERAMTILKSFRDPLNPRTIEGLASKIDKLKSESPSAVETNSAIHAITTSLRESVAKMGADAGYAEGADLAKNFAQAMDKLDNFTGLFKATSEDLRPLEVAKIGEARKGQPVILPEVEKTKIINDLSTLFSGNKDVDKDVLKKVVFGGQQVLSREAGRTIATATDKASTKLGDALREVVISPVISPKTIGLIVAKTALKAEQVGKFINQLKKLEPAARGSVIELISRYND